MPADSGSVSRGAKMGASIGALVGVVGSLAAWQSYAGLLFVPCLCLCAWNNFLYTDAGPSNPLAMIALGVAKSARICFRPVRA